MKTLKKILKALAIIVLAIFLNGIYYVFYGQFKSAEKLNSGKELNLYECCSTYSMHVAATLFCWIISPEASYQCRLMMLATDGSFHIRKSSFMKSEFINNKAKEHKYQQFVLDFPTTHISADKGSTLRHEMKYALAYDGAIFKYNEFTHDCVLELEVKYDPYISYYKIGPFGFTYNQQLLSHIQNKGWLHKCHVTYIEN